MDAQVAGAQANLVAVFLVNIPYTIVPILLMWCVRHRDPFGGAGG